MQATHGVYRSEALFRLRKNWLHLKRMRYLTYLLQPLSSILNIPSQPPFSPISIPTHPQQKDACTNSKSKALQIFFTTEKNLFYIHCLCKSFPLLLYI